jgi:hypothetical protein
MRIAFPLLVLTLATGAAAQQSGAPALDSAPLIADQGARRGAPMFDHMPLLRLDGVRVCRDAIQQIRDERGLPKLDRDNAASDEPLLIAAVDQRIGGCSVMVMRNDTSDIRPLPTQEGSARLQRLPGQ